MREHHAAAGREIAEAADAAVVGGSLPACPAGTARNRRTPPPGLRDMKLSEGCCSATCESTSARRRTRSCPQSGLEVALFAIAGGHQARLELQVLELGQRRRALPAW